MGVKNLALSMKEISEKYDKFSQPKYYIEINGKKLDEKFTNNELTVEITASHKAGSCTFSINNGFKLYKENKINIDSDIKSLIKLGNKVEIILGYFGVKKKKVFTGYIDSLYVDYHKEEGIVYTVECLDGKGIMMNSLHSETKKSIKKYSAAVEEIFKKYSSLIKIVSKSIDKSDKELTIPIEQHNESDYDFVVRIAKKINYNFFIINGEVSFRKRSDVNKSIMINFNINEYVLEFKMFSSLKNLVNNVTVRSNNEKNPDKPVQAVVNSYKNIAEGGSIKPSSISKIITDRVSRTIIDYSVSSEAEARLKAQSTLDEISMGVMEGYIKTPGIPDLVPGRIIKVTGFGEGYDKKYFVSRVVHEIKGGNFTTLCDLEVNKL